MTLYWNNDFGKLYLGDSLQILETLEPESAQMCITSPPYWAARDYSGEERELGQEYDLRDYITNLCDIFDQVKPVLHETGSLYVVIGDTYFYRSKGSGGSGEKSKIQRENKGSYFRKRDYKPVLEDGCLAGIPDRFCVEMLDRGWILRNEIIWWKRNAMVTSAKNRFTVDFESIFFFVREKNYLFNQQLEPLNHPDAKRMKFGGNKAEGYGPETYSGNVYDASKLKGRNKRTVWDITVKGFSGAHFATFPEDLVETPILASSNENQTVLDPFFGAGTTGLVAQRLNRNWIGIEKVKEFADIAIERITK